MAEHVNEITPVNIEDELKQSYLDYAMSVIIGRALPSVEDGLKPVHRRVLYTMHELKNDWNKPYKKSARIVGDVMGKYHPHGDTAIYDSIVRMAQPFSMRYLLVDGQGNFGSVDGDPAAAMRYTEIRMSKLAHALLVDLEKDTVDFTPNYDDSETQPVVLPTRVPNLLVNGSSGIAVGMATNIPPHNLTEVINAMLAMIADPKIRVDQLMVHLPGPDFPTYGLINGRAGIVQAYKTGRGRIRVRAKTQIEDLAKKGRQNIIIEELPYQVNKARLIEKIAELVKERKIEGISGLRDESDKDGMRVVIELKRGESAEVILNNLYAQTQLQVVFGMNMVAIVDGQPQVLTLPQILTFFIRHRKQVVTRRTRFELNKARLRAHLLEGLSIALANIDPVIQLIKQSKNPQAAKTQLVQTVWKADDVQQMLSRTGAQHCRPVGLGEQFGLLKDGYHLSFEQAQAILDLRLHRLTGLEQTKIVEEFKEIIEKIQSYLAILSDESKLLDVIKTELTELKQEFGDARRTQILDNQEDFSTEDLITEEDMVVTLSHAGYAKAQPLSEYQAQRRGGKGKSATSVKDEDFIAKLLIASTHDTLLCFSGKGKVYWLKVHQLPVATRNARGRPIVNLLPLVADERITAILPIRTYDETKSIFMATRLGTVKRVGLSKFAKPRNGGILAIDLVEADQLIGAELADEKSEVVLSTTAGKAIRFKASDVRIMGRSAKGVRGIKLKADQTLVSLIVLKAEGAILTATTNGYGKRTAIDEYSTIGRGGKGVISIQTTSRNGAVIGAVQVFAEDELMLISDQGTLVRIRVDEISLVGRNTQGVHLIRLAQDEHLVGIQRIEELKDDL